MVLSTAQLRVLVYLQMEYTLTCHFTDEAGLFDAALEKAVAPRQTVPINTLKALLRSGKVIEKHRRPFGEGLWVVEFVTPPAKEQPE